MLGGMERLAQDFQAVGLIFDVAGVAILGVPAAFRMRSEIAAQMGTYWNYNPPLARALSASRVDISAGSLLLILGFAFQIAAFLGYRPLKYTGPTALIGLALFFVLYWLWARAACSTWLFSAALQEHEAEQARARAARENRAS